MSSDHEITRRDFVRTAVGAVVGAAALAGGAEDAAGGLQIIMAKRRALRGEEWPLSPPPLCVSAADEKFGLGTSRMSEITLDRAGWPRDILI